MLGHLGGHHATPQTTCCCGWVTYPSNDSRCQLEESDQSILLLLGDATWRQVPVLDTVCTRQVLAEVLVVKQQGVKEVLPGHGAATCSLNVFNWKAKQHSFLSNTAYLGLKGRILPTIWKALGPIANLTTKGLVICLESKNNLIDTIWLSLS